MRPMSARRVSLAVALVLAVGVAACGTGAPGGIGTPAPTVSPSESAVVSPDATSSPDAEPPETGEESARSIDDADLVGTFGGDAQLEGGCAWVDGEDGKRYEVIYPNGWQ